MMCDTYLCVIDLFGNVGKDFSWEISGKIDNT